MRTRGEDTIGVRPYGVRYDGSFGHEPGCDGTEHGGQTCRMRIRGLTSESVPVLSTMRAWMLNLDYAMAREWPWHTPETRVALRHLYERDASRIGVRPIEARPDELPAALTSEAHRG